MSSSQNEGRPLPKFGEWDVNDPASADGFTVIFSKARDEKKTGISSSNSMRSQSRKPSNWPKEKEKNGGNSPKRKWLCCISA